MTRMPADPAAASMARYLELREEVRSKGLDRQEVDRSRTELSSGRGDECLLDESAYVPTGVVLGTPLPNEGVTNTLHDLGINFSDGLRRVFPGEETVFAKLPPSLYHLTLVNRSHFDCSDVTYMTDAEFERARVVLADCRAGSVEIELRSLILTPTGRLIVPGYPTAKTVFDVRRALALHHGHLGVNVPRTVHIKLGHVLVSPDASQLAAILELVDELSHGALATLTFHDVHTPMGRITL